MTFDYIFFDLQIIYCSFLFFLDDFIILCLFFDYYFRKKSFNHFKKPIFSSQENEDEDFFDHDGLTTVMQQFHDIVTALEDESMFTGEMKKEFQNKLEENRVDLQKYAEDNDLDGK